MLLIAPPPCERLFDRSLVLSLRCSIERRYDTTYTAGVRHFLHLSNRCLMCHPASASVGNDTRQLPEAKMGSDTENGGALAGQGLGGPVVIGDSLDDGEAQPEDDDRRRSKPGRKPKGD